MPVGEHGLREDRKVRPIACAEVLIKLCEGVDVKLERPNLDRSFDGVQFGNGAPDGAPSSRTSSSASPPSSASLSPKFILVLTLSQDFA